MRTLSRKAAAWTGGAIIAAGGVAAGAYAAVAHNGSPAPRQHVAAAPARPAPPPPPLRLLSVSPAAGSRGVDGADSITVTFNQPLPASAPLPRLSPAVAGAWQREGDAAVFTPQQGIPAGTRETVMVSAGDGPVRSEQKFSFTTAAYSTLRLQELLAQLGYLPMSWAPAVGGAIPDESPAAQLAAAYQPPPGTFTWRHGYPSALHSFWRQGSANLLAKGAITGFEADHGLTTDGVAGPRVWAELLRAAETGAGNRHGYSYAIASQSIPETLTIWHDGRQVFSSAANTGISAAPTPVGTFPVYEKLPSQVMQGTNPDGSHYADPVQWVSYFEGGSAVHYIARGSYGYPQSLGCVELPYSAAAQAYPYLPYGTLVTVTP
ncbi:MAG: L,D-transpeptidase family protein [Trebonia sp.]|uniref:L,D-transpeptidase family protein n=1 Tax=Trebonia sp. TaxID=2767075 RepID=UPI003BB09869